MSSHLLYLVAASAAAADVVETKASQVEEVPAHMPCHHDLAPTSNILVHTFHTTCTIQYTPAE